MNKDNIHPCPECGNKKWKESYVGCEDCGDHTAVECTSCGARFDHVWGDEVYDKVCESYGVKHAWDIKNEQN